MRTSQLLDEFERQAQNFERELLLSYLDQANRRLFQVEATQNVILDSVTGKLPFLATTDGVHVYDWPQNAWGIGNVLVRSSKMQYSESGRVNMQYAFGNCGAILNEDLIRFGGHLYWPVKDLQTRASPSEAVPCQIIFQSNPGTTTDVYHVLSYQRANELLSENIQHNIPEPYDMAALVPTAKALLDAALNGTTVDAHQAIEKVFIPMVQKFLNSGAQGSKDFQPVDRSWGT